MRPEALTWRTLTLCMRREIGATGSDRRNCNASRCATSAKRKARSFRRSKLTTSRDRVAIGSFKEISATSAAFVQPNTRTRHGHNGAATSPTSMKTESRSNRHPARIDLGTRIWLPWYEVREATLETIRVIAEKGDTGTLISRGGPHCALGTIYYPDGQKGILLYIKSSLSGDENDYIIDYKRRYLNFPHETTGDQFFSENQFEAYRNLDFHATQGFFSGRDEIALTAAAGEPEGAVRPESKNLKSRAQELLKYHRPGETLANVKRR